MSTRGWTAAAAIFCDERRGAGAGRGAGKAAPLRTGVDGTFAPHAFPKLDGGIQGFNVDLFTKSAVRSQSIRFSTLIPGMRLTSSRLPRRSPRNARRKMLFTAGYIWMAYQVGIEKGSAPIKGWEDLKGKAVAVCARPSVFSLSAICCTAARRPTK
jgi:polar amino acid transport system substrate-binding protein